MPHHRRRHAAPHPALTDNRPRPAPRPLWCLASAAATLLLLTGCGALLYPGYSSWKVQDLWKKKESAATTQPDAQSPHKPRLAQPRLSEQELRAAHGHSAADAAQPGTAPGPLQPTPLHIAPSSMPVPTSQTQAPSTVLPMPPALRSNAPVLPVTPTVPGAAQAAPVPSSATPPLHNYRTEFEQQLEEMLRQPG